MHRYLVPVLIWLFTISTSIKEYKLQKVEQSSTETTFTPASSPTYKTTPLTNENTELFGLNSETRESLDSISITTEDISETNDYLTPSDGTPNFIKEVAAEPNDLSEEATSTSSTGVYVTGRQTGEELSDFLNITNSSEDASTPTATSDFMEESTNVTGNVFEPTETNQNIEPTEEEIITEQSALTTTVQNAGEDSLPNDKTTEVPKDTVPTNPTGENATEDLQQESSTIDTNKTTEATQDTKEDIDELLALSQLLTGDTEHATDDDFDDEEDSTIWQIQDLNSLDSLDDIESVWDIPFK